MKKIYLVDGSSIAFRSFYAFIKNPLINSKGENTSAIFGFVNSLLKLLKEEKCEYMLVAFDAGKPTFRHERFKEYKATRKKMPYELSHQIPIIKEIIKNLGIKVVEEQGVEADDIIGSIAVKEKQKGNEVIIFSQDKDFLQLEEERIRIMHSGDFKFISAQEKLGISSKYVPDFLGLCGDSIDNIPGVPGIGPKTAATLINSYGSIEQIYDNIDSIKGEKLRETLKTYREQAFFSKELSTINKELSIEEETEEFKIGKLNRESLFKTFRELELFSIMQKFSSESSKEYKINSDIDNFLKNIGDKFSIFLGEKAFSASTDGNTFSVFPYSSKVLEPAMKNPNIEKITLDAKALYSRFDVQGPVFDLSIASYLLRPSLKEHSLDFLALEYLGKVLSKEETKELGEGACVLLELAPLLKKELEDKELYKLFTDVEMPLAKVLSTMQTNGILIDKVYFEEESRRIEEELKYIEKEIYRLAGKSFNINSPKQLGHILFEELGLPKSKKTKTGYSTSAEVLLELAKKYELPKKILDYRELFKLKSTYIDVIPKLADKNNRVHTTFIQTATATGRLSSVAPNLQNIPRAEIRKGFIAPAGSLILSADYSQIELRILADVSGDTALKEAFRQGEDIHKKTALSIFNITEEEFTQEIRRKAKVVNFGIIYGMGPYGLSKELGCSTDESALFITSYFLTYPGVKLWIDRNLELARQRGYTTTILGRRRYLENINSENVKVREFEERVAINAPIQGSCADMIKVAMINIDRRFREESLKAKMILQVHDELVFEVPEEEIEKVKEIVKTEMENALKLSIPVVVDIGISKNWYSAH